MSDKRSNFTRMRKSVMYREAGTSPVVECYWCGQPISAKAATLEHLVPRAWAEAQNDDPVAISCCACNLERGCGDDRPKSKGGTNAHHWSDWAQHLATCRTPGPRANAALRLAPHYNIPPLLHSRHEPHYCCHSL